jgi:hypothetical protein
MSHTTNQFHRKVLISIVLLSILATFGGTGRAQTLRNVATDATDPHNLPDTEPSIAVNPRNPLEIVIATFSEPWGPDRSAPVWRSLDGGATWTKIRVIPQPPSRRSGPGDQYVAYDSNGRLYLTQLDLPPNVGHLPFNYIYRQNGSVTDNFIPGKDYGDDQPLLNVDLFASGPCFNRLYSPWLGFVGRPRSMVTHSGDQGISVANVAAGDVSVAENRTSRLAIARTGKVYLIYKVRKELLPPNFERAQFQVVRSDDCGSTWKALGPNGVSVHGPDSVVTWFTKTFGNPDKGKVNRARSSDAWIATDPGDGEIYVAYVSRDATNKAQIYVARSRDEGVTWTSTRITDGSKNSGFPEIAVTANGTVGVLYIDYDDSGAHTIFRHQFAKSFDAGATWTNTTLQAMNPTPLGNANNGFIWGDFEGLTAFGNTFYGAFTGQSLPGARTTSQLDPIFFMESGELQAKARQRE